MLLTKQAASNFMVWGRDREAGSFCPDIGSTSLMSGNSAPRSGNLALRLGTQMTNFEVGDRDLRAGSLALDGRACLDLGELRTMWRSHREVSHMPQVCETRPRCALGLATPAHHECTTPTTVVYAGSLIPTHTRRTVQSKFRLPTSPPLDQPTVAQAGRSSGCPVPAPNSTSSVRWLSLGVSMRRLLLLRVITNCSTCSSDRCAATSCASMPFAPTGSIPRFLIDISYPSRADSRTPWKRMRFCWRIRL